jgi:2-dehydropantoate 2-reductase
LPWRQTGRTLVHFSGALQIPDVHSAHPLMTFGENLEPLDWYRRIPFVLDEGDSLAQLLPGLENPSWPLTPEQRPLYHALASLAGNSSYLLWQKIGAEFEKLGLPRTLLAPFLHQVVDNALKNSSGGWTGPVARGDWQTVLAHLRALQPTPLAESYEDYLSLADRSGLSIPKEIL